MHFLAPIDALKHVIKDIETHIDPLYRILINFDRRLLKVQPQLFFILPIDINDR